MISEIRDILLNDWDPIHVGDNPNLRDEYDSYINRIVQLLATKPSINEIINLMRLIENEEIGVQTTEDTLFKVAHKLQKVTITNAI